MVRVALVCQLIIGALKKTDKKHHLISVDEKTGIQALSRIEERAPNSKGKRKRMEFEYKRNGTICLIAAYEVGTGKIIHRYLNKNRKEADFLLFIQQTLEKYPPDHKITFLADQLNTHMSATLVEFVAQLIGYKGDLGVKGSSGILKNMETRKAFLEIESHRVRVIYTPKHCSWLNPVENWFAKLQRSVIKNGNFESVDKLEQAIIRFVDYYNKCLAKPLKWKFKGFSKEKVLANFKESKT